MSGRSAGDDDALDDAVAHLARSARRRNLDRADRVLELLEADGAGSGAAVAPGAASGAPERDAAARLCHAIAGSAGTFGDQDLADAARDVESVLLDGHPERAPAALHGLRAAADALRPR